MIKGLILLLNLFGIFLSGLFFPASVTVTQTAPSSAERSNSVLFQITINKGDLTGPGKFVEELPLGFNAVPIDDEGAKTSFDTNTIVFSWDALPTDGSLNISFRVDINSAVIMQNYSLKGRFLYTDNNQKTETDCAPSNITITGANGSAAQNSIPVQNGTLTPQASSPVPISTPQQMPANLSSATVFVVRQFSSSSIPANSDATITLTVHKGNIKGFAKIEDSIPPGYTAAPMNLSGSSFTFIDNTAKFVWQNMPADSVITISYRLSAGSDAAGTHAVAGNFSYIYNDAPHTVSIGSTTFDSPPSQANNPVAQSAPTPPVSPSAPTEPTAPTAPPIPTPVAIDNSSSANTTPVVANNQPAPSDASVSPAPTQPEPSHTDISVPEKGITYRVQIMALHSPANISSILKGKKLKEHVKTETQGGLTKYTIGNYTDYASVKAARDDLRNQGFPGAFVVSYKSGVRISLQEAISTSH